MLVLMKQDGDYECIWARNTEISSYQLGLGKVCPCLSQKYYPWQSFPPEEKSWSLSACTAMARQARSTQPETGTLNLPDDSFPMSLWAGSQIISPHPLAHSTDVQTQSLVWRSSRAALPGFVLSSRRMWWRYFRLLLKFQFRNFCFRCRETVHL